MSWITSPRTSAEELGFLAEKNSSTGYEPNDHFITEAYVEYTQESISEQRFPEDLDNDDTVIGQTLCNAYRRRVDLSEGEGLSSGLSSPSMSHDRTGKPVVGRDKSTESGYEIQRQNSENEQIRTLLTDKGSKSSLIVKRRLENTNSRPIMTEEENKNWMKRSSRRKKKFIVLNKETNDVDEINNFFMHSYWSKTGSFVKLMRKVSMKGKNWGDLKAQHSTQLREEDWSKIKILSWNLLARNRNCKMKLIVWMIQEIFKMLNQYAVDNPTLPVNQYLSHLIQFLVEC